jgi:levanbiose-producing levanase
MFSRRQGVPRQGPEGLTCDIIWDQLTGAGLQLRRSADGGRHVDVGGLRRLRLRQPFLVDRTSVEMFVDDGQYAHSTVVFPDPSDTCLALLTIDGQAVFRTMVIRGFAV